MSESLGTRLLRFGFNLHPGYRGTGARITYIARDKSEVHVKLPLNWRTRGKSGAIFGGCLYAAIDPIFVVMLTHRLGRDYAVWDKAATIQFKKPGRSTLYARFRIEDAELDELRRLLARQPTIERTYVVDLTDAGGAVHTAFTKTIHFRNRKLSDAVS